MRSFSFSSLFFSWGVLVNSILIDAGMIGLMDTPIHRPQGTFLAWVNFGAYVDNETLMTKLIEDHDLLIEDGRVFGEVGQGHFRISIACPRDVLKDGIDRIVDAIKDL